MILPLTYDGQPNHLPLSPVKPGIYYKPKAYLHKDKIVVVDAALSLMISMECDLYNTNIDPDKWVYLGEF